MPDTRPRIVFDQNGVCNACLHSKKKELINWSKRKKEFLKLIDEIHTNSKITMIKDNFFSKKKINESIKKEKRPLATRIIGDEQFSGCLMQPHYFVVIDKK
jgi:hypothetical protein